MGCLLWPNDKEYILLVYTVIKSKNQQTNSAPFTALNLDSASTKCAREIQSKVLACTNMQVKAGSREKMKVKA